MTYSLLLEKILQNQQKGWADIEKIYYELLKVCTNPSNSSIEVLNDSFKTITYELEEYLSQIIIPKIQRKKALPTIYEIIFDGIRENENGELLFVNFNYTNTLTSLYNLNEISDYQVVNIHGIAKSRENPIIFGYGDEMDENFKEIENMDDNRFLRNMKSFGYFLTNDYKRILNFMSWSKYSKAEFQVHVIGHSMGLSDRLLLNTIFEHKNCQSIEIHYSSKLKNFDQLARNMSRHFNLEMKGSMREKIVPYLKSRPMNF